MNIDLFLKSIKELTDNDYIEISYEEFMNLMNFFEKRNIPFYYILHEDPPENCIDCGGVHGAVPVNMKEDYNGMHFILKADRNKYMIGLSLRR